VSSAALTDLVAERAAERAAGGVEFFEAEAGSLARCCRGLASQFARGGRLLAAATGGAASSDAEHVAVEFVHPVIVGKRALPALALRGANGPLADQVRALARPEDVVMAFDDAGGAEADAAVAVARELGALTVGFGAAAAEWSYDPGGPDPFARQEVAETAYHVLWELVHVFLEHAEKTGEDGGPAAFLYPFLGEQGAGGDPEVLEDVRRSVLAKAREVADLRARTLAAQRGELGAAATAIAARLDAGGRVLAFGNGGSATDAADMVADLRSPPPLRDGVPLRRRRAIDLSAEPAVLTAIANDVGAREMFRRQLIAHGEPDDVAVAISTSGDSENLCAALAEARSRGLATLALVGSGGGRIAAEGLADHLLIVDSDYIPRIQEAQASLLHVLRELIDR
jgi:D-sedoheptulose 7-phosphate isomerase